MKNLGVLSVLAAILIGCAQPPSYEPFVLREDAEYGDSYSFILDLADSTVSYSLDFYTRLERQSFEEFPSDSIMLDLRWFSPSDSILSDTTFISIGRAVDSAYYSRDFITSYKERLTVPERGKWRLKARVVNDMEELRGLGIILKRN